MTSVYHIKIPKANIDCWAKLESQNPTGTHKDRSIGPWIEYYTKQGIKDFAIASSGNSAIAATKYCAKRGFRLRVFTPQTTKTPRKDAFQFSRNNNAINLRASTDDHALIGYKQIAYELIKQLAKIDNIFVPTSSGATLEGVSMGFKQSPAFFVIQTTKVHPIASYFDKNFETEKTSKATAIVDRIAHRRDKVIKICQETGGGGFVVSNQELREATKILTGIMPVKIKYQSALAFAGFLKWRKLNPRKAANEVSVCLFTD